MALEKSRGRLPQPGELAVVVGAGRSGRAAAYLLRRLECKTRLLERDPKALSDDMIQQLTEAGVEICPGDHQAAHFENASFVIPSPGVPLGTIKSLIDDSCPPEIISEMELAWRCLDDEPVLAVSGTSGKTTTASLAAAMLKAQGYAVFLGGNIGTPLSEYVLDGRKADVIVVEASSFQLQGCVTFCPRVAILLNISPNHLDYHKDMEEYIEAKFRLFRCQDEGDLAIIGESIVPLLEKLPIASRKIIITDCDRFKDRQLLGRHNSLNAEAAWQAARFFGVSEDNARYAVEKFPPLPHRLEIVRDFGGVTYVNDSKCTTVAALKVALEAFDRPVRLLCGGKFKGGDLRGLNGLIKSGVVEVALFGASREHFENAWKDLVPISWHPTLEEAMRYVHGRAAPGDVVLLAPATSSYDLYENYMERGNDFRRIAGELS